MNRTEAKVIFGQANIISETRTPIYVEFEGRKYSGFVMQIPAKPAFIRWSGKVPEHIRHSSTGFLFEFTKQLVEIRL